jgi:hypothetical protein
MRRRRIASFLTAGSVVLSAAVVLLWMRSLSTADWLSHSHASPAAGLYARTEWIALSAYGFVGLTKAKRTPADEASALWLYDLDKKSGLGWSFGPVDGYSPSWSGFTEGLGRLGLSSGATSNRRTTRQWTSLEIPDWLLLLIVSVPAQLALLRKLRVRNCPTIGSSPTTATFRADTARL